MTLRLWILFGFALAASATGAAVEPPRLAVVISIDQCRADYLERFQPYFGPGGFNRLLSGAVYTDCHHRHAATNTANGHATLVTGVHAEIHGIIANEWLNAATLETVYSVGDPAFPLVGAEATAVRTPLDTSAGLAGASPSRLLATTIGDQLKLRFDGRSRVLSLSNKDRAAILMGGRLADGAYWLSRGRFVTSRFYRPDLPAWVQAFNAEGRVERDFGQEWTRLLDESVYTATQGPDNAPGEESRHGLGTTFPRKVDGGKPKLTDSYYDAYRLTPFSSVLLGDFAAAAVHAEELGHHASPDLLCLSFSQTDYCGHSYGPDSHEIMDSFIRLDRVIADLLVMLDREVGRDRYVVVLSGDHGVSPLPERIKGLERGVVAERFDGPALTRAVEAAMTSRFGAAPAGAYWVARDSMGIRFRLETLRERGVSMADASAVAKAALRDVPQVAAAFTREDVLAIPSDASGVPGDVRRSFHAARSQDVVFVLKPYVVDRGSGSNHSTPYDYDTHVPLVWYGAGVTGGIHHERVGTDQLAPTLCGLMGIPRPPQALGRRLF